MMSKQTFTDYEALKADYKLPVPEDFNFVYDVFDVIAAKEPKRRAMIHVDRNGRAREFDFAWFAEKSARLANALKKRGMTKGDRIMLVLYRSVEFWITMLALHRIGAVAIPGPAQLTVKDIVFRASYGKVKGIICEDSITQRVEDARKEYPGWKFLIQTSSAEETGVAPAPLPADWLDFYSVLNEGGPNMPKPARPELAAGEDPLLVFFSSGTTGMPKMVQQSHSYPLGHYITGAYWHDIEEDDIHLTLADTGWGKAVWGKLYGQWMQRGTVFVWDFRGKFEPAALLKILADHLVTTFCAPPTVYRYLVRENLAAYDLSALRHCTTAGELLNDSVFTDWQKITGLPIYEGFGQTESTLMIATFKFMTPKPGSIGRPVPGWDVILLNADNAVCQPGEEGEICVRFEKGRPPVGLFQGYVGDAELTAKVLSDTLYRTGDKAWMDEDGYFWFLGRVDDLIKSSGYRIGPFEVESALVSHPAVIEAAVTGVPDPVRGQAVKATVVLAQGFIPSDELTKELQNHVKQVTAPYKYPRILEYVKELPKTISGKIRRAEIRARDKGEDFV